MSGYRLITLPIALAPLKYCIVYVQNTTLSRSGQYNNLNVYFKHLPKEIDLCIVSAYADTTSLLSDVTLTLYVPVTLPIRSASS
jgi:hypothetical protein